MAALGDRIVVSMAKGAPSKRGKIIAATGSMLTIEWDDGHVSTFFPAPGAVTIEASDPPTAI